MTADTAARATYARAASGYDPEHEAALLEAITSAIVETSMISDAHVMALRTGEIVSALVTVLAGVLAMSPSAVRSPTATRRMIDELHRRLRRRIAQAERDPGLADFPQPRISRLVMAAPLRIPSASRRTFEGAPK